MEFDIVEDSFAANKLEKRFRNGTFSSNAVLRWSNAFKTDRCFLSSLISPERTRSSYIDIKDVNDTVSVICFNCGTI